jgi:DNA-3-methyladenine glycosylase II
VQAARLRTELTLRLGDGGALPTPQALLAADLDLPGRKAEYLRSVAAAALDGVFEWDALRSMPPERAVQRVQQVKGLGPFAAELVVLRGANAPDMLPTQEPRLNAEVLHRYGRPIAEVGDAWRPFRTWAAVHLRALRDERTHEIGG